MRDHQTSLQENDNVEVEDTLSLSDLPIYNDQDDSDLYNWSNSKEFNATSNEQFEFLTTDSSSVGSYQQIENIVFCGKSIVRKDAPKYQERYTPSESRVKGNKYFFRMNKQHSYTKTKFNRGDSINGIDKNGSKFKWCSLLFGLQRVTVPATMDLAEMRYRQSKIAPKSLEMLEKSYSTSSSSSSSSKLDQGLSYLLRSLSCRGSRSMDVLS